MSSQGLSDLPDIYSETEEEARQLLSHAPSVATQSQYTSSGRTRHRHRSSSSTSSSSSSSSSTPPQHASVTDYSAIPVPAPIVSSSYASPPSTNAFQRGSRVIKQIFGFTSDDDNVTLAKESDGHLSIPGTPNHGSYYMGHSINPTETGSEASNGFGHFSAKSFDDNKPMSNGIAAIAKGPPEYDPDAPLLGPTSTEYRSSWLRWYILFVFSLSSFNQCLAWFTFSSIPARVKEYYPGVTDSTIDLLLNWGAIVFIPVLPYVSWLQTRKNGLLWAFWQGAALVLLGTVIRTVPCWMPAHFRGNVYARLFLHAGQICIAAAGPIVMAVCSKISVVWFPDHQRATATAIAYTSNSLGVSIGYLLGPAVVKNAGDFPILLYIEIASACAVIIGGLIYYRERPPHPPSAAAAGHVQGHYESSFIEGLKQAIFCVSFVLLVTAAGLQAGVTSGVLPQVFDKLGYSDKQGGWLGFGNSLAGIFGGVIIGPVSDLFFRRKFKLLLITLFSLSISAFVWFTLSLPLPSAFHVTVDGRREILDSNYAILMVAISTAGFFQGALGPVFYELSAELVYPVPEATSGGVLVLLFNAATLVFLFVSPQIDANWMNLIQTGTMIGCLILVIFVKANYKRSDAELVISGAKEKIKRQKTEDKIRALDAQYGYTADQLDA